jgi:hypothetical protein
MRSLFRTFSLGLICFLLIVSSDAAINIYGHRVGRSLAAAQGTSVVSVKPRAYQTPYYSGDSAVNSPLNTEHGETDATAQSFGSGPPSQAKSCQWFAFPPVSGQITRITLKFDWSVSGLVNTSASSFEDSASANASFDVLYSTNSGSTYVISRGDASSVFMEGGEFRPFSDSGSVSVDLPANTPINQIIVYDRLFASASASGAGSANASVIARIWNISLEVETLNCPASVPADRWKGEFYNNTNLSGIPTTVRDDGTGFLNFNFGDAPPAGTCGVPADNFSARWTRTVNFSRGLYRFTVTADDGVRLYVDGQVKINAWVHQAPTTYTAEVFLTTGNHEIKLEYFEATAGALISLNWTTLVNCLASVPAGQWRGEYYNGVDLTGELAMVRDDGNGFLNFNWGNGSPGSVCGQVVDNFSARWTRTFNFAAGTYLFFATADNGVRLYVDGISKIDQWGNPSLNTYTAEVSLSADPHEIKLEFVEYTGDARVSLFWIDASCLASVPVGNWRGEYFNNITLTGHPVTGFPAMVRNDGTGFLNFNFGNGGPGGNCGLGVDNFSARWTRTVNFGPGTYRFSVTGDDGVRLYVGGQPVINAWFSQGATTYTENVTFSSAGPREVKLEYFESGGPGVAILTWVDLTGVNCLPDAPLPLISSIPQTSGKENIASTAPSHTPKRCDPKIVTPPRAPGSD